MNEMDASLIIIIIFNIIFTWSIGLIPPLVIRYIIMRKSINKWPAIAICVILWFANILIFTALGTQSKTHFALTLVGFVSYWILRKSKKPVGHFYREPSASPDPKKGDTCQDTGDRQTEPSLSPQGVEDDLPDEVQKQGK